MKPAFNPKRVETRKPRGPVKRTVPLRYFAIPNTRGNPDETLDVCDVIPERNRGRVEVDLQAGEIVGVRIIR